MYKVYEIHWFTINMSAISIFLPFFRLTIIKHHGSIDLQLYSVTNCLYILRTITTLHNSCLHFLFVRRALHLVKNNNTQICLKWFAHFFGRLLWRLIWLRKKKISSARLRCWNCKQIYDLCGLTAFWGCVYIINAAAGVSTSSSRYLNVNCSNYAIKCACLHCIYAMLEFIFLFDFVIVCLLMLHDLVLKALLCYYLYYGKQYVYTHIFNETELWKIIDSLINFLSGIVRFKVSVKKKKELQKTELIYPSQLVGGPEGTYLRNSTTYLPLSITCYMYISLLRQSCVNYILISGVSAWLNVKQWLFRHAHTSTTHPRDYINYKLSNKTNNQITVYNKRIVLVHPQSRITCELQLHMVSKKIRKHFPHLSAHYYENVIYNKQQHMAHLRPTQRTLYTSHTHI